MKNNMFRKGLVIGIIMLFVGASVVPSISGNDRNIVYGTDDGNADNKSIQDSFDNVTLIVVGDNDYTDTTSEEIYFTEEIRIIFEEDFESGWDGWWADNGVWEVGVATVGPESAHSGQNCAGTILGDDYPSDANTRLISPEITLPSLLPGERLNLKFWHWFRLYVSAHGPDEGRIQISVNGGDWENISGPFSGTSPIWSQVYIDLSAYADSTVRIAFYFTSDWVYEDNGWYVDDISITAGPIIFNNPEDFELGIGDWWVDNGVWEVGVPTVGPESAHSGQNCAGTILGSNYPSDANTRLISPEITLTSAPGRNLGLYFWHWFRLYESAHGPDEGRIQISVNGGDWENISGPFSGTSPIWNPVYVNLSDYAGSTVRIAFYFTSDRVYEDNGWYVDDVEITGLNLPPETPTIDGITNGKKGAEYEYIFNAVDPDGDDIEYFIDWDDGNIEEWIGPYTSGDDVKVKHIWSKKGIYIIRCKAKDVYDEEGPWGTLEVAMPKNQNVWLPWWLNRFPLLQRLLSILGWYLG